jgi:two-component system OmpR family sensor kinase
VAVERILVNLLSNAAKYTPIDADVRVRLERGDDDAVLSVSDNGPGVSEEERERIFELFYRSDGSARTTRGVGIGLALARQLVDHLNGTIGVDEAPGGGAVFRVTIPLVQDPAGPARSLATQPAGPG